MPESMSDVLELRVPRESVNADSVYVVTWSAADGAAVTEGADLCTIETSKASVVLAAPGTGFVRQRAAVGDEVAVGGILGYVTPTPDTPLPDPVSAGASDAPATISDKAMRKIQELGLDPALFVGRGLVRERDVVEVAAQQAASVVPAARAPYRLQPLGAVQRRVAATMERSVTVPVSYLAREVDLTKVRERAIKVSRELKTLVSPIDLLVAAVASTVRHHPVFNAAFRPSERQVQLFDAVHVGVAMDVDDDLYVVVITGAGQRPVVEVATELRRLQMKAGRRQLTPEDLTGATITVTSMLGRGVHRFQPLLPPEQTAIIALADAVEGSSHAELSIGFDHRVANGSGAAAFLTAIAREWQGEVS